MSTPVPASGKSQSPLVIPPETQQKFPDLLVLIQGSESMNDEERQYWINILPIMTPDQVENLQKILTTEKQQLAAIDKKYTKEISALGQEEMLRLASVEREKRRKKRESAEKSALQNESSEAENLLKQIETAGGANP